MARVLVIAEAGVNHNGDPSLALRLVEAAAEAGADMVKFQTFRADALATAEAPKAVYQERSGQPGETQLAMLRRLELDLETHRRLMERSRECGIGFLSTPFDQGSLDLLAGDLGLKVLKLPSGELTNAPLLLASARTGADIILSTGMSDLGEVEAALGVLAFGYAAPSEAAPGTVAFERAYASVEGRAALAGKITLLHCTTEYPCPLDEANLRAMDTLADAFGLPVGFSDHTDGVVAALAAAARGAVVVEKHFTLDRDLPGPDHRASVEPETLAAMVQGIRQVEAALGDGDKRPTPSELPNRRVARKSLVALKAIAAGEPFTLHNLGVKRPGDGLSPMAYWDWIGRPAPRAFVENEAISP